MTVSVISDLNSRPFRGQSDFRRVRDLLIETYPITPAGLNWEIRRWEGQCFHRENPFVDADWCSRIRLWETKGGKLVGVAHPEGRGDFHLQIHPGYRALEPEMIAWAEAHLSVDVNGQRQLETFVFDDDIGRQNLLRRRGYEKLPYGGVVRRKRFDDVSIPQPIIPDGYHLRTTRPDYADYQHIATVLNAAFNRTIHTAEEYRVFSTQAPSFRHDLNFVAEAPDGSFASHVGVTYCEANRYGVFEPVCTHPDHQRKGLARALMLDGLHQLQTLGAADAYLGTGEGFAANALYAAVGFELVYHGCAWQKRW